MSNKDIWQAYEKNKRSNKTKITETYHQVLKEEFDYDNADYMKDVNSSREEPNMRNLLIKWVNEAGFKDVEGTVVARLEFGFREYQGQTDLIDLFQLEKYVSGPKPTIGTVDGSISLRDLLIPELETIFKPGTPQQVINGLYMYLFGIVFTEGTVSVGRGELILTLFTQCVKGTVGDVEQEELGKEFLNTDTTDGIVAGATQIEVKTGKGRAVSARGGMFKQANYAIERAVVGSVDVDGSDVDDHETFAVVSLSGGFEGRVKKIEKGTTVKYEPLQGTTGEGLMTIDQFITALQQANIGKLKPFEGDSAEQIKSFLDSAKSGEPTLQGDVGAIRQMRHDISLAALLWKYANPDDSKKGFHKLLAIRQHGQKAAPTKQGRERATISAGTFDNGYFIDCSTINNIYTAMQSGMLTISRGGHYDGGGTQKAIDGEGVYISFGDSNTEVGGLADYAPHYTPS